MAVLYLVLITLVAAQGSKSSSNFTNIFTTLKIIFITTMVSLALSRFKYSYWNGVLEDPEKLDIDGVLQGASFCYFGFVPVELTSSFTKEAINPKRDVPRSVILVPGICLLIYFSVSFALTGIGVVQSSRTHDAETAVANCFDLAGLPWVTPYVYYAALIGITACALSLIKGQSLIFQSLSEDGFIIKAFSKLNPRTKTPAIGTWLQCIPIAFCAFCFDIPTIGRMSSVCSMFNYVHMNVIFICYRLRGGIETRLIDQTKRSDDGLIDPNLMEFEYESNLLNRRTSEYWPYLFVVLSTLNAYSLVTNQANEIIYLTSGAVVLCFIAIWYSVRQSEAEK